MVTNAYSLLASYIYGFALTKMSLRFDTSEAVAEVAQNTLQPVPLNECPTSSR